MESQNNKVLIHRHLFIPPPLPLNNSDKRASLLEADLNSGACSKVLLDLNRMIVAEQSEASSSDSRKK